MHAALLALSLLLSQVPPIVLPCIPGDSTVVCKCKQGTPAACAELAKVNPELLKGILRLAVMAQAIDSTGCGSGQDPNEKQECTGQSHHIISMALWKALELHHVLRGHYSYRDSRLVARAKDLEAHCGYQKWHQNLDEEIAAWIRKNAEATIQQFEAYLREVYSRPELLARFPNGF